MKQVIFLNGPPRCGKDTIAAMKGNHGTTKFAQPIRDAAKTFFKNSLSLELTDVNYDEWKEKEIIKGSGVTLRQWMINWSEKFMKPTFGEDIFGKLASEKIERLLHQHDVVFITDSGFLQEAERVIEHFNSSSVPFSPQFILLRIFREGCTFKNDSRSYIDVPNNILDLDIKNDQTINHLHATVKIKLREIQLNELTKLLSEK